MLVAEWKKKKIIEGFLFWIVIIAYSIINILLIKYHEPWRDEAQIWLIGKNLSPLEILDVMKYEGHPCLWYFIIFPFSKLGFPYISMNLISFTMMLVSAYLFLKHSPFPFYAKMVVVFSPIFIYFYPVISRSYCLIPLFVILLAILYPDRHNKTIQYGIVIGLLVQAHVIMLGMAGMLILFWMIESILQYKKTKDKKQLLNNVKGIFIPTLSIIFLFFQLMNVKESTFYGIHIDPGIILLKSIWGVFSSGVDNLFGIGRSNAWIIVFWSVILLLIILIEERKKEIFVPMIIVSGSIFFELIIYTCVYGYSIQKLITCVYILLWGFWLTWKEIGTKIIRWFLSAVIVFLSMMMIVSLTPEIIMDIKGLYSDSKNLSSYINENLSEDSLIITNSDPAASSLIPFLQNRDIWNPVIEKKITYIKWDQERQKQINDKQLIEWIKQDFPDMNAFYLICADLTRNRNFIDGIERLVEDQIPLYQTEGTTITDESFALYLIPVE